ncbi:MAG: hypothetical protein WC911_03690 [Thermoleophilia bacterium]
MNGACPYPDCGKEIEENHYEMDDSTSFEIECPHCERGIGVEVEFDPYYTLSIERRKYSSDWDRRRIQQELYRRERRKRDHGRRSNDRGRWLAIQAFTKNKETT